MSGTMSEKSASRPSNEDKDEAQLLPTSTPTPQSDTTPTVEAMETYTIYNLFTTAFSVGGIWILKAHLRACPSTSARVPSIYTKIECYGSYIWLFAFIIWLGIIIYHGSHFNTRDWLRIAKATPSFSMAALAMFGIHQLDKGLDLLIDLDPNSAYEDKADAYITIGAALFSLLMVGVWWVVLREESKHNRVHQEMRRAVLQFISPFCLFSVIFFWINNIVYVAATFSNFAKAAKAPFSSALVARCAVSTLLPFYCSFLSLWAIRRYIFSDANWEGLRCADDEKKDDQMISEEKDENSDSSYVNSTEKLPKMIITTPTATATTPTSEIGPSSTSFLYPYYPFVSKAGFRTRLARTFYGLIAPIGKCSPLLIIFLDLTPFIELPKPFGLGFWLMCMSGVIYTIVEPVLLCYVELNEAWANPLAGFDVRSEGEARMREKEKGDDELSALLEANRDVVRRVRP